LWWSKPGDIRREANKLRNQFGASVIMMDSTGDDSFTNEMVRTIETFGPTVILKSVPTTNGQTTAIRSNCQTLQYLGLQCLKGLQTELENIDPRLALFLDINASAGVITEVSDNSPPGDIAGVPVLFSTDGKDLPLTDINRALQNMSVYPPATMETIWQSWIISGNDQQDKVYWLAFAGILAVMVCLVGLAAAVGGELSDLTRQIGPLAVLNGRRSIYVTVAVWRFLCPLLLAAATGLGLSIWLTTPLRSANVGGQLSPAVLGALGGAVLVTASLITLAAASWCVLARHRWHPGK
jgi:hypothetical protein